MNVKYITSLSGWSHRSLWSLSPRITGITGLSSRSWNTGWARETSLTCRTCSVLIDELLEVIKNPNIGLIMTYLFGI